MTTTLIDLGRVRETAAEWHGGQASALYALASSGAIDVIRVGTEILADMRGLAAALTAEWSDETHAEFVKLDHLMSYVLAEGERGPVEGWHLHRF